MLCSLERRALIIFLFSFFERDSLFIGDFKKLRS